MTGNAQLALDTIRGEPTGGIPAKSPFVMEHSFIERIAGTPPGSYRKEPEKVYVAMQRAAGTCMLDQYIPRNPLTMGPAGFENAERSATTGADEIELDGMAIRSPEDVAAHMEKFVFPGIRQAIDTFDEEAVARDILDRERRVQETLGPDILKCCYGAVKFPSLWYSAYGYADYFMAYALYPEIIEKHFSLQADLALLNNRAAVRAYAEGPLPPFARLDHDMADSRGTLVDVRSLDWLWFPHFARCLEPALKAGIRMVWHCDGNLMEMVPRLLDAGLCGFQGFQYEDGMDYEKICRMKDREGRDLLIIGGVSVTTTLPHGTPEDVRKELEWLVRCGPKTGLFLGGSSSITPGVPWENLKAFLEGLAYYRTHGRN